MGLHIWIGANPYPQKISQLEKENQQLRQQLNMTKAKILALLGIIAQLQNTAVTDTAAIADLKKQIADLHASDAELQDPDLIAAVDAVIGNAAATPPPSTGSGSGGTGAPVAQ